MWDLILVFLVFAILFQDLFAINKYLIFVMFLYFSPAVSPIQIIPNLETKLICLLLFTCNYVVSVWRGFLFLWVLGMGYVILLWHSLSLPYKYEPIILGPSSKPILQDLFTFDNYLFKRCFLLDIR